ncbi:Binding-protein-dependent transport system inner membrane component [uncultured archaeon]|nr:Binding-protein-dependent transport system inner membrane component [uncultured archaeon]
MKQIIGGVLIILIAWSLTSHYRLIDPFFLPPPTETIKELINLATSGTIMPDVASTLTKTLTAFLIAALVGIPAGLLIGNCERIYRTLDFPIDFFRSTPPTALFPLFLLAFGISDAPKIAAAAFGGLLIITFNTAYGVINANKARIKAAKLMGASGIKIFTSILLWETLPQTIVGLRSAISLSLIVIIVTEMFIGTQHGLGRRIIDSQITYNTAALYATILATGILGYLLNQILRQVERRFAYWTVK